MITYKEFLANGLISEFANCFDSDAATNAIFEKLEIGNLPNFENLSHLERWKTAILIIELEQGEAGLIKLLHVASEIYPANLKIQTLLTIHEESEVMQLAEKFSEAINYEKIKANGILIAICDCFSNPTSTSSLFAKVNINYHALPSFGIPTIQEWWQNTWKEIELTQGTQALVKLLQGMADIYPGNPNFSNFLLKTPKPEIRNCEGEAIALKISGNISAETLFLIMEEIRGIALRNGTNFAINLKKRA